MKKIEVVAEKFSEVVALASQALHGERICFKVFMQTMKQKATYFLRVFHPEVSKSAAKRLCEIFQNVTRKILGWTPEEFEASKGQAAVFAQTTPECPRRAIGRRRRRRPRGPSWGHVVDCRWRGAWHVVLHLHEEEAVVEGV